MRPLEPRDESEIPTPHPNIFSLLVFGVNRTLRVGVYILAGSVAVYVTMGQLYAFITGWTLILHLVLATAYLTRAWSYTFDSLIGNHISQVLEGTFSEHMPSFLAPYPDFVALALVLLMAGVAYGISSVYDLNPSYICNLHHGS